MKPLSFPLLHAVILTLCAPRPSAVVSYLFSCFSFPFLGLYLSVATSHGLLRLWVYLVESLGFLAFLFSVILLLHVLFSFSFVFFAVLITVLCILNQSSGRSLKPSVPFHAGKGWTCQILFILEALPFWLSNAVITDNFNTFLLLLETQSATVLVFQVVLADTKNLGSASVR